MVASTDRAEAGRRESRKREFEGKKENGWEKRQRKETLQQRESTHRIDSAARNLETAGLDSTPGRSGASRLIVDASAVGQTPLSGHSC
ncbi:hypothetical protein LZ30DRAFT_743670 [Colletotrichum cereale]|nr:hypothetical protein LZ30DRAFT_743670 [Colletotrichum cereale]